jgi:hypothetical protein
VSTTKGINVRFDHAELNEVRAAIAERRDNIEKIRAKLGTAGLDTLVCDQAIEVLDGCRVAIGDEPEDMFGGGVDKSTGEITE